MKANYRAKGGSDESFNCVPVRLDESDLNELEQAIKGGALPAIEGFFFGASDGTERPDDLHFIHKARDALAGGMRVYYFSWW